MASLTGTVRLSRPAGRDTEKSALLRGPEGRLAQGWRRGWRGLGGLHTDGAPRAGCLPPAQELASPGRGSASRGSERRPPHVHNAGTDDAASGRRAPGRGISVGPMWTLPRGPALGPDNRLPTPHFPVRQPGQDWGSRTRRSPPPQAHTTIHNRWVTLKEFKSPHWDICGS